MSAVTYGSCKEEYLCAGGRREAYGIVAYANADGSACIVASVHDLSCDRVRVEQLAALCNRLHLSPEHLPDIAEDFLTAL